MLCSIHSFYHFLLIISPNLHKVEIKICTLGFACERVINIDSGDEGYFLIFDREGKARKKYEKS